MTDQERIEALIESLNTICDRMKGAGLGRYVGRIREAAAQLRADHPAQGEAIPADDKDREPLSDLADWEDLCGRAPDATGGISSEAFVRELRDGWR